MFQFVIAASRASACGFAWRSAGQYSGYGTRGRGIADAHVSRTYEVRALLRDFKSNLDFCVYTQLGLGSCHCRAKDDVGGATACGNYLQIWMIRKWSDHASVDYDEVYACLPCHDVNSCASRKEVLNHLYRNFLGIAGDALGNDTVIACGYDDCLSSNLRHRVAEHACQLVWRGLQAGPSCRVVWSDGLVGDAA